MVAKVKASLIKTTGAAAGVSQVRSGGATGSAPVARQGRAQWNEYVKQEAFIKAVTAVTHKHRVIGYADRADKALDYLQGMQHQQIGKVSQADATRATTDFDLPAFNKNLVPADFETDEFVLACEALKAAPGTRICQVSQEVATMIGNKKIPRNKMQGKIARHYQNMGILAVYAPGEAGLKVNSDGSQESEMIAGKGSVVFLSQDQAF
jgi:hypothetical protein